METRHLDGWTGRPVLAGAVRCAVWLVPFVAATLTAFVLSMTLDPGSGWTWGLVRLLLVAGTATLVMRVTDRAMRRTLPLASLLELTLVFPDQAPSRVSMALRAASSTELGLLLERYQRSGAEGPARAAEHLLDLVAALSRHDHLTRGHSERVRAYAQMLGAEMGLSKHDLDRLRWAALIHDIGKLRIDGAILNKPGRLTDDEFEIIKAHPDLGAALAEPLAGWLGDSVLAVVEHHEKWDGSGYPRGLAGTDISLAARIVAVADVFDVITSARSYKEPRTAAEARAELARCAGTHFDPEVVRAFLNISVGRLRRVVGPLSWVTSMLLLARPASASTGQGAAAATGTTGAGTAVSTVTSTTATTAGSAAVAGASAGAASAAATGGMSAMLSTAASGAASLVAAASGTGAAMGVTVLAGVAATGIAVAATPEPVTVPAPTAAAMVVTTTTAAVAAPGDPVVVQVSGESPGAATTVPLVAAGLRPASAPAPEGVGGESTTPTTLPATTVPPAGASASTTTTSATPAAGFAPVDAATTTVAPRPTPSTTALPVTAPSVTAPSVTAPSVNALPDSGGRGMYLLAAGVDGDAKSDVPLVLARREPRNVTVPNLDADRNDLPGLTIGRHDDQDDDQDDDHETDDGTHDGDDDGSDDEAVRFALRADRSMTVKGDMTAVLHLRVIDDHARPGDALASQVEVVLRRCKSDGDDCEMLARAQVDVKSEADARWPRLDDSSFQAFQAYKVPLGKASVSLSKGQRMEVVVRVGPRGEHDVVLAVDAAATPSGLYVG